MISVFWPSTLVARSFTSISSYSPNFPRVVEEQIDVGILVRRVSCGRTEHVKALDAEALQLGSPVPQSPHRVIASHKQTYQNMRFPSPIDFLCARKSNLDPVQPGKYKIGRIPATAGPTMRRAPRLAAKKSPRPEGQARGKSRAGWPRWSKLEARTSLTLPPHPPGANRQKCGANSPCLRPPGRPRRAFHFGQVDFPPPSGSGNERASNKFSPAVLGLPKKDV